MKERLYHYFHELVKIPALKIIGIQTAIISKVWINIQTEIFLILFLSTLDLISGILVSIKYKKVSSWGLRQSVLKVAIYLLLIFLGGLIKEIAHIDWIDPAFLGLIMLTETTSILENIQLLFPGVLPNIILQHFGITINKKRKRK